MESNATKYADSYAPATGTTGPPMRDSPNAHSD